MTQDVTFETLPKAVAYLIEEVTTLKSLLVNQKQTEQPAKRLPIGIEEAKAILQKATSTIYRLVGKGDIPHYKQGRKLYFYEDELLDWVAQGKRKSSIEIREEMEREMSIIGRGRPRKA
ncbi:MAG: helix-turn-helix domain-containing protein [Rikenellaceae bacterium]